MPRQSGVDKSTKDRREERRWSVIAYTDTTRLFKIIAAWDDVTEKDLFEKIMRLYIKSRTDIPGLETKRV